MIRLTDDRLRKAVADLDELVDAAESEPECDAVRAAIQWRRSLAAELTRRHKSQGEHP